MSTYNYVEWEKKRRRAINALVMTALDATENKSVYNDAENKSVSFAEIVDVFPELSKSVSDACDARIHRKEG